MSAWLLPASRASWAAVMHAEVQLIENDREALKWAVGSVHAGLAERLRVWQLRRLLSARSAGILWIVIFIVSSAFNVSIALAARLGWERMASTLGWWLRGFQYDRFVPLARAMPIGLFALMGAVVAAFCISLYLSLRKSRRAFAAFCAALGLSLAAWLCQLGIPAYAQAISAPHRWRSGMCFVLTIGVLSALWRGSGARSSSVHRQPRGLL
jgi:hypothetical protein